jgi:hypothetical protein
MRRVGLLLPILVFAAGCQSYDRAVYSVYETFPQGSLDLEDPSALRTSVPGSFATAGGSHFTSDQVVLSNEAIAQILATKLTLPAQARLTVMPLYQLRHWSWSESLGQLDKEATDRFLSVLAGSKRVSNAALLPTMLLPARVDVPKVREAAARYQVDLVLLYRPTIRTFEKARWFAPSEVRAHCTVEAVLLDVRTGIVRFATTASGTCTAARSREDASASETEYKAEVAAAGQALERLAADIVKFLDAAP